MVCIDLCSAYRQLVRKWFPNAKIVADRFHAIRIIQYHFLSFCRATVPAMKHRRGLIKALRKTPENLTEIDQQHLDTLFHRYPLIQDFYRRQSKLRGMLKLKTLSKDSCRQQMPALMDSETLKTTDYESLHSADDKTQTSTNNRNPQTLVKTRTQAPNITPHILTRYIKGCYEIYELKISGAAKRIRTFTRYYLTTTSR